MRMSDACAEDLEASHSQIKALEQELDQLSGYSGTRSARR